MERRQRLLEQKRKSLAAQIAALEVELAKRDQILAIPTLARKLPELVRKIIGDLSNTEKVLEICRRRRRFCWDWI